ncbi:ALDH-like protein [Coniochaeta ligniaria NRRL 30616]|uniref:aldehyde dehydrogenase (NAD(+)) n=1 Tax=Coniochaeta ligniaria NRRL 30616 TaxID=1408157 RepID=A0A1J7IUL5_9PEZI|nr:ALDH-like protein [Coniochaeta ligniaria NRRL 30616]
MIRREDEVVRYKVPPAKYPEKHEILERPSIKKSGTTAIQCYAPATGQFLAFVNPSTPAAIDRAIDQAQAAQKKWATTTFAQRRAVLRAMLQHVLDNQEEICRIACLDSGKTMVDAELGEIMVTTEKLQWTIKHGERALSPSRRPTNLLMAYKRNTVRYEPLGVVAALVSWNYPFHNFISPVISALFAGNAAVVKVSEQVAWSAAYFANVARGALVACGHDPGLVQTVVCWPQTAGHLTAHPGVGHITFIGSRAVCRKVAAGAAGPLTPLVAELGGKDASVVLDSVRDGELGRVVNTLMRGTFQASGQNCIGIERIIAGPRVYDRLVAMLEPKVRALRLGPEGDVGGMISDANFGRLEGLVGDAILNGARMLVGGKRYAHPDYPNGHYFSPTLVADVTTAMEISKEECFGPIMVLMRAESGRAQDILALVNAPNFGLGGSVFGAPSDPVLKEVVKGMRAGMVAVNDFAAYAAVHMPFGGVGGSGYGRFYGEEGLRGLCNIKSVCEDRMSWLGIRTSIPPPIRYPVADQERSWRFAKGVVEVGYATTVKGKVDGLVRMMKNM